MVKEILKNGLSLIKDIQKYGGGRDFVIVSGAIALGRNILKLKKKIKLEMSQAVAALVKYI